MKILLADDDEGIIDAVSMMLEMSGHEVTSVRDGNKVIATLQPAHELVILDTWMSGVDGRDICQAIKNNPLTKDLPVMMISASHEIKDSALKAGADKFIAKPFEMDKFLSMVSDMKPA